MTSESKAQLIVDEQLKLEYYPDFLTREKAGFLLGYLEKNVVWGDKTTPNRRVSAMYGDSDLAPHEVSYGGYGNRPEITHQQIIRPWSEIPILKEIRDTVAKITGAEYNYVVIQRYPSATSTIGFHRDREVVPGTTISGISLGSTRTIVFKPPASIHTPEIRLPLTNGSLYVMQPPTNDVWFHSVEKSSDKEVGLRLSLTYRLAPK